MELFVYETPYGPIADFRPYLDGRDHAFDDHRPLEPSDPRQEKIATLRHPEHKQPIAGKVRYAGQSEVAWRELMIFPIAWNRDYDPVDWE
jgi:hypothetical protein